MSALGSERYAAYGLRIDFARLELVSNHSESERTHKLCSALSGLAVDQNARKLRNLCNPAAVRFLL
jgi:hypothetical protein